MKFYQMKKKLFSMEPIFLMTILLIATVRITPRSNRNELSLGIVVLNFPHCLKVDSILGFSILCSHTVTKAAIAPRQLKRMFGASSCVANTGLDSIDKPLENFVQEKMTKILSLGPLFLLNFKLSAMYWSLTVLAVLELDPKEDLN